jgi:hypothetical protein
MKKAGFMKTKITFLEETVLIEGTRKD